VCCIVLQCVAVCCSVVQCVVQCVTEPDTCRRRSPTTSSRRYVAVCCSVLQCVAEPDKCRGRSPPTTSSSREWNLLCCALNLKYPLTRSSSVLVHLFPRKKSTMSTISSSNCVLQCVAVCCSLLQCVEVFCSVLKCFAVCCDCAKRRRCLLSPSPTVCCSVLQ